MAETTEIVNVYPDPEVLKEVAEIPTAAPATRPPLSDEEKREFMNQITQFSDWWQLPLPKWCQDMMPLDNPMAIKMFMWDAEHQSRIKAGEETMPSDEFAKFETQQLNRLDEYRRLRREKNALAEPEQFKMVADHQGK